MRNFQTGRALEKKVKGGGVGKWKQRWGKLKGGWKRRQVIGKTRYNKLDVLSSGEKVRRGRGIF